MPRRLPNEKDELERLESMRLLEIPLRGRYAHLAGVDEAGRGPLAGPVVAAACIIPSDVWIEGIDDSKKLKPARRAELYQVIIDHPRISWAIATVTVTEIDALNIHRASLKAMSKAVEALTLAPDYLFIDGNAMPETTIPGEAIVDGDACVYLIAAASILAKEFRDREMARLDNEWPGYGFAQHKGYPTQAHLQALKSKGPSPCHRRSFGPVRDLL